MRSISLSHIVSCQKKKDISEKHRTKISAHVSNSVVWFNLGMHHVPHTGDLPNTVFTTAQSSVLLSPHNYLLSDPSRATSQQAEINFDTDDVTVSTFGSTSPSCTRPDLVSVNKIFF